MDHPQDSEPEGSPKSTGRFENGVENQTHDETQESPKPENDNMMQVDGDFPNAENGEDENDIRQRSHSSARRRSGSPGYSQRNSHSPSRLTDSRERHSGYGGDNNAMDKDSYHEKPITHIMDIRDEDASFILGAGGRTKLKLSKVCGANLTIREQDGKTILEIKGQQESIDKAILYVGFVVQQRVGPVALPEDAASRDDLTIIEVPHQCVGYVTGRKGSGLRAVEEEWNTLMFFTDLKTKKDKETERLAIFGTLRNRRGSELKVMSAVEQKMPGYFTTGITEHSSDVAEFDTDHLVIPDEDYSYALGQRGSTRKKLARASGAIIEYVGHIAFITGTQAERIRAREYLKWLCQQRTEFVHVDTDGRLDCEIVKLPLDAVAYVTGAKGSNLRRVEDETGTFIFLDGARGGGEERLLIFCHDDVARQRAKRKIEYRIDEKMSGRARPLNSSSYGNRVGYNRRRRSYHNNRSPSPGGIGGRYSTNRSSGYPPRSSYNSHNSYNSYNRGGGRSYRQSVKYRSRSPSRSHNDRSSYHYGHSSHHYNDHYSANASGSSDPHHNSYNSNSNNSNSHSYRGGGLGLGGDGYGSNYGQSGRHYSSRSYNNGEPSQGGGGGGSSSSNNNSNSNKRGAYDHRNAYDHRSSYDRSSPPRGGGNGGMGSPRYGGGNHARWPEHSRRPR